LITVFKTSEPRGEYCIVIAGKGAPELPADEESDD
jgi:hypothetical protein